MSMYNKFNHEFVKVPVQFGGLSKRPRKCRYIGTLGSMMSEKWYEDYYRIDDNEIAGGRFFYIRTWKGDKEGNIDKNGKVWSYTTYTQFKRLPDEIKKIIEKKRLEK